MRKPGVSLGTRNMVVPCLSGTVEIRTDVEEEQLAHRRVCDKGLLAVEDPLVAVALALELQPGLGISSGGNRLSEPAVGSVMPLPSRKVSSARNG